MTDRKLDGEVAEQVMVEATCRKQRTGTDGHNVVLTFESSKDARDWYFSFLNWKDTVLAAENKRPHINDDGRRDR